jgi:hypothetical protein
MLPASLQTPAALVLLAGGVVSCFAGYRAFRVVLGIYGFIIGALFASSAMGTEHTVWMIGGALVGGVVGALILIAAYFIGVALLGAGVGALAATLIWASFGHEPGALVVILFAVVGALAALALQRYVIIGGTALAGAWTMIVGALALAGNRLPIDTAPRSGAWLIYPMNPAPGNYWILAVLVALWITGVIVQLGLTAKGRK